MRISKRINGIISDGQWQIKIFFYVLALENILVALTKEIGDGPCFLYIKFSWIGVPQVTTILLCCLLLITTVYVINLFSIFDPSPKKDGNVIYGCPPGLCVLNTWMHNTVHKFGLNPFRRSILTSTGLFILRSYRIKLTLCNICTLSPALLFSIYYV